jgi:hypothetical protein
MKTVKKTGLLVTLIFLLLESKAQQGQKQEPTALQELAKIAGFYKRPPVRLRIELQNTATPLTTTADTLQAWMEVYYDGPSFYLHTGELEEIVNDTLGISINHAAKQILLTTNRRDLHERLKGAATLLPVDSSLKAMDKKYTSQLSTDGRDRRVIDLRSREDVYGTTLPKEAIRISYQAADHQPLELVQSKTRLLPVDSAVYVRLQMDVAFAGRLVQSTTEKGNLYFLAKTVTTTYRFGKVEQALRKAVIATERIVKTLNGDYLPAKGYEAYQLTRALTIKSSSPEE